MRGVLDVLDRLLFAVVTIKSIFVYDSQHPHPLVKLTGLHFAPINDAAWSGDGRLLVVCSSDGYLTFVRFPDGSLGECSSAACALRVADCAAGEPLEDAAVPEVVRRTNPLVTRPAVHGLECVARLDAAA